jgi:hypothetical protein
MSIATRGTGFLGVSLNAWEVTAMMGMPHSIASVLILRVAS